tara:strand:+ start:358 stop:1134 length:777 start_codon:yes stop_codon:yes gene_type:complete
MDEYYYDDLGGSGLVELVAYGAFDGLASGLVSVLLSGGIGSIIASLLLILVAFVGLNFSNKFKKANVALIEANPTTVSNPVIFTTLGVIFFLNIFVSLVFIGLPNYIGKFSGDSMGLWVLTDLVFLLTQVVVMLAVVSLFFNPEKANVKVDTSSSVAEDLIALASFALKVPLVLSKLFSQALILVGSILMLISSISLLFANVEYGDYSVYGQLIQLGTGIFSFLAGAFVPFVVYLVFLLFYPINNYLLAILHIPRINK